MPSLDLGGEPFRGLVVGLASQREGAPVDPDEVGRAQVDRGLDCLLGRDVHRLGDLPRGVGADRQGREVEGSEGVADLLEVTVVPGVTAEVEALGSWATSPL